jgi:hypothetical protein
MNAYFTKMTKEEKENILDQHKKIYDGYVTQYGQNVPQPLYVQDFANDKGGITINNKGEVTQYKNMNINEMRFDGKSTGLFDEDVMSGAKFEPEVNIESEEMDEQLDMIGDGVDDLEHGTFGKEEESEMCSHCGGLGHDDMTGEECEWCDGTGEEGFISKDDEDFIMYSDIDEEKKEPLKESVNKTLDMFKRFKKF